MTKLMLTRFSMFLKAAVLTVFALAAVACADYDDKNEIKDSYYAYESALIEAETLKGYIDNGHRTPDGRKVVIIDVTRSNETNPIPAQVIKGALEMAQNSYFTMQRTDGPVEVGNMVADGAKMDAAIRYAGIDENTLVVITATSLNVNNIHRVFWTFKYWGFSNKAVKVLNGANQYFAATYADYMEAPTTLRFPSTFSVKDLPGNAIDSVRAPLGEIIADVKAGAYKEDGSGAKIMIPTMSATTSVKNNGVEETKIANNNHAFGGRIKGATQLELPTTANNPANYLTDEGKYKTDEEEIKAAIVTFNNTPFLPDDKNKRIIVHCGGGQSTAPHWFVLREILGYTNAAIYDGSWNEWGNLTMVKPANAADTFVRGANQNSYLTWVGTQNGYIDSITNAVIDASRLANTGFNNANFDTSRLTDWVTLNSAGPSGITYHNDYQGEAKEINEADKNYQQNIGGSSAGSNAAAGGGAPSGC